MIIERVHFIWNHEKLTYEGMLFLDNPKKTNKNKDIYKAEIANQNEYIIKEIINDINKCYKRFKNNIEESGYTEVNFKEDLYRMLRILTISRQDLPYCKKLCYIAMIFLINSDNYYSAYVMFINFICNHSDFLFKFLTRDEIFIKSKIDLFDRSFKKMLPKVYKHFKSLDISTSLFIYDWFEYIFVKTFVNFNFILQIFDLLLIRGEIILYELALSIIKIQQKELQNVSCFIIK